MINWHDRYAKLLARERGLFDVHRSVLEVGCGPWGIALWLQRPVTGLERDAVEPREPLVDLVRGDVLSLPFDDGSFDYVVCADVLEHLPESDRTPALAELVRVARGKVLVTCPCGSAAEEGEAAFAALLRLPRRPASRVADGAPRERPAAGGVAPGGAHGHRIRGRGRRQREPDAALRRPAARRRAAGGVRLERRARREDGGRASTRRVALGPLLQLPLHGRQEPAQA